MKKAGGPPPSDTQIRKVAETAPPSKSAIRSESETRKRVKINEVPEYAPAKLPVKTATAAVVVTTHQVANLSNVKLSAGKLILKIMRSFLKSNAAAKAVRISYFYQSASGTTVTRCLSI